MSELKVGSPMSLGGFFTRLLWVAGRSPTQLEDGIGYHRGRLREGYLFLAITERIRADEIALVGHSHFSGGRIGHPAREDRITAEESLRREFGDGLVQRQKQQVVAAINAGGSDLAVKVLPQIRHDPDMSTAEQYPVGLGIPQFNLLVKKTFVVVAVVRPGQSAPKVPAVLSAVGPSGSARAG